MRCRLFVIVEWGVRRKARPIFQIRTRSQIMLKIFKILVVDVVELVCLALFLGAVFALSLAI